MEITSQQSTHPAGGFFFWFRDFLYFSMEKICFRITRYWELNSAKEGGGPQYVVSEKNIDKNPPLGDGKYKEKVAISTIDFVAVN